jgi:hypothetical protein
LRITDERSRLGANKGVMENVGLSMEKESSGRKKATYAGVVSTIKGKERRGVLGRKLVGVWDFVSSICVSEKGALKILPQRPSASLLMPELLDHRNFKIVSCS